jgi:hypothetical protein
MLRHVSQRYESRSQSSVAVKVVVVRQMGQ